MARAGSGVRQGAGVDRRLRRSSTLAAAGDGIVATALALLAARVTRDPLAIAAVVAAQHLPWVLVELLAGRVHIDRRTVLGLANTARALAVGALGVVALISRDTILSIQLVVLVVGLGEAADDRAESEVPDVGSVASRGMAALALGLLLGGLLYELYPATPLFADLLVYTLASTFALAVRRPLPALRRRATSPLAGAPVGAAAAADGTGLPPIAGLLGAAALASAASSAVLGVLVLFALDDLGLGAPAFGMLLAGLAVALAGGGRLGAEIGHLLGVRPAMVLALVIGGLGTAGAAQLADPDQPWAGALALGVASAGGAAATVLARAQLTRLVGREHLTAALDQLHLVSAAAIPVGALLAGWLARHQAIDVTVFQAAVLWALAAAVAAAPAPGSRPLRPGQTPREIG